MTAPTIDVVATALRTIAFEQQGLEAMAEALRAPGEAASGRPSAAPSRPWPAPRDG